MGVNFDFDVVELKAVSEPLMTIEKDSGHGPEEKKSRPEQFDVEVLTSPVDLDETFYAKLHSIRGNIPHAVSDEQAMMNLIKAVIGTGILSLPEAFRNSGLWFACALVVFTNLINVLCIRKMVKCAHKLCKKSGRSAVDYGEMGELAVTLGPKRFRRYATTFREMINGMLYLLQFGSCAVYFIFIAENIRQAADPHGTLPVVAYIAFVLPVELVLCSIRQLKWLSIPSTFANVVYVVAFAIVFYYVFDQFPSWQRLPAIQTPQRWPLAFGSIMFAFSSAGTILPIENRCKTPARLLHWNGVINTSYWIITILSTAVGFYGYIKYGDDCQGSITLNLPDEPLAKAVKVMVALTITLSFPLQFYSPMEVISAILKRRIKSSKKYIFAEYGCRFALVLLTFMLAALVPRLGLFISLVGALTGATLAFLFPPIIDILTEYSPDGNPGWLITKNLLIILFGMAGLIAGTVTSIDAIVQSFS
ncbi:Proton-coupled amino acid transporter 4 [Trichinella pseudospiralis]|uniref:Proton-coupled amino acid transporter 4 n=2 Tax=Trichinella pseudospiralis TaxID=6337 RepID=A0A0V1EF54_TRIPS|nr:Proton-coupled amino acid transporter 4 [Trichinella pseudospiralis]KRZ25334.1 Proton-coupled amino acid transporter 4 [Trichinella pseudospiralis]KRZ37487.1 Proton-coupled amino acid transporter 4 [Trichinella pseudospiralis]